MQFLYYCPNDLRIADFLASRADAFPGGRAARQATERGPDGKTGAYVVAPGHEADLARVEAVEWSQAPAGRYWIGVDPEALPGPEDLARETVQHVYAAVPLGDSRAWYIPTARVYPEGTPLPKVRKAREDGTVERKVRREYHGLCEAADEVWDALETGAQIDEQRETGIAMEALRTNYRIGLVEASLLELLDDDAMRLIFFVLVDAAHWPEMAEARDAAADEETQT